MHPPASDSTGMSAACLTGMLLATAFATSSAHAQSATGAQPFSLRLGVDLPVMVVSATIGASWLLRNELTPASCAPRCDQADLAAFDRAVAGRYDSNMRLTSDLAVAALLAGGAGVLLFDGGWVDLAVGTESVLVASAIAVTTMFAVRRPRPWLYGEEAPLRDRERGGSSMSFPSGHTANAFAVALALFRIQRARHPGSSRPYWLLAGAGGLAVVVATTRVLAGDHFPSDVLAGALLGGAVGWAVPELHRVARRLSVVPSAGGLAVSGAF
jgi:membrane-associated phospholipid phosphatase